MAAGGWKVARKRAVAPIREKVLSGPGVRWQACRRGPQSDVYQRVCRGLLQVLDTAFNLLDAGLQVGQLQLDLQGIFHRFGLLHDFQQPVFGGPQSL